MKAREYECPECGEFEEVSSDHYDDVDMTERDGDIYEYIAVKRFCHKCGHAWTEYLRLVYDGYFDNNKIYLPNGEEEK